MERTQFLKSLRFFDGLDEDDIQTILNHAHLKNFPKKTTIHFHGDTADYFYIIMHGWVKLHQETAEGNEVVIDVYTRGDSFGEDAIEKKTTYSHSAQALEDCQLIEISSQAIQSIMQDNPSLALHMINIMNHQIAKIRLENEHLAVMSTSQRVGCYLLQLCLSTDHCDGHIVFPYNKNLVATRLGMKPETFSRAMTELKAIGITVKGNDIYIADRYKLESYCCLNCSSSANQCPLAKRGLCSGCQKTA
jgi:CRP-like cAMP-binding protein